MRTHRRFLLAALAAIVTAPAALAQGFDLGSSWRVTEYSSDGRRFDGTWTRVGERTFRARWRDSSNGQSIEDTIRFVALRGNEVVLHRAGLNGRYYGRLSPDGRTIEGRASWYRGNDYWTAEVR